MAILHRHGLRAWRSSEDLMDGQLHRVAALRITRQILQSLAEASPGVFTET